MTLSLKSARANVGLTQKAAAKELGITQKTLSFWENGKTKPNILAVEKICVLYKVSYENIRWT